MNNPRDQRGALVPASRGPEMTAVQKRDAEDARKSEVIKAQLQEAIDRERASIEAFLSVFGISFDIFKAGLTVFLSRQQREQKDFFVDLHIPSFMEALTRIAMNGLLPDGKEAAIAAYRNRDLGGQKVAQAMFMRDGFVKVLWRTGMVKSINDQVVTEDEYKAGRFEYEEGDQGFIQHKLDLMRKDSDPVVAAYCIIELVGGGVMREVVPKDELDKMARMSKSPARQSWAHQMHRKGAIRRIMGKMPREKSIVQLLQHDDESYDLKLADAPSKDAPDHKALFGNKPIRRPRKAAPSEPLAIEQGADMVMDANMTTNTMKAIYEETGKAEIEAGLKTMRQEPDFDAVKDAAYGADDEGVEGDVDTPFVLTAVITSKNGPQQYAADQEELWFGDLQDVLKRHSGAARQAAWDANRGYVEQAGLNGHAAAAMKLVGLARDLGVMGGARD